MRVANPLQEPQRSQFDDQGGLLRNGFQDRYYRVVGQHNVLVKLANQVNCHLGKL